MEITTLFQTITEDRREEEAVTYKNQKVMGQEP